MGEKEKSCCHLSITRGIECLHKKRIKNNIQTFTELANEENSTQNYHL